MASGKLQAGDANGRNLAVPVVGNMLEGEAERTRLVRRKGKRGGAEQAARLAEYDLIQGIAELNGHFHLREGVFAGIGDLAGEHGHLLVDKVLRAAHRKMAQLDARRVGLFGGTERQLRFAELAPSRAGRKKVEENDDE